MYVLKVNICNKYSFYVQTQGRIQDFPLGEGSANPIEVGTNVWYRHFSAKMYAKTQELGPGEGVCGDANGDNTNDDDTGKTKHDCVDSGIFVK